MAPGRGSGSVIRDRDATFVPGFRCGVLLGRRRRDQHLGPCPGANAIAERFLGTLRRDLLDRVLIVNPAHARHVLLEYEEHFTTPHPVGARNSTERR